MSRRAIFAALVSILGIPFLPIRAFLSRRALPLSGLVVLGVLAVGVELVGVGAILPLVTIAQPAASGEALATTAVARIPVVGQVSAHLMRLDPQWRLLLIAAALGCAGLLRSLINFTRSYLQAWCFNRISHDIHTKCFEQFLQLPLARVTGSDSGTFVNTIVSFPRDTAGAVLGVTQGAVAAVQFAGFASVMLLVSWKMTLASIGMLLLVGSAINRGLAGRIDRSSASVNDRGVRFYNWIIETVRGRVAIDSLGATGFARKRFELERVPFLDVSLCRERYRTSVDPLMTAAGAVMIGVILAWAAVKPGDMTTGVSEAIVMIFCLTRLMGPVSVGQAALTDIRTFGNSANRVASFLAEPCLQPESGTEFTGFRSALELHDVSFAYAPEGPEVLRSVRLALLPRQLVGLVGRSGAGKSTLVSLMMRFYAPSGGSIRADGVDISEFSQSSWRRRVCFVPQDNYLFNDTIENNIRVGLGDLPMDAVIAAARAAHAHDFIEALPAGYQTAVGEAGLFLSGGQRQRIAIARAVLRRPALLILDEATSQLDSESERAIAQAIAELRRQCAILVIAHRFSTIAGADRILVLDQGRVVEQGSHAELVRAEGLYKRFLDLQALEGADASAGASFSGPGPSASGWK